MSSQIKKTKNVERKDTNVIYAWSDTSLERQAFDTQARIERLERLFESLSQEAEDLSRVTDEKQERLLREEVDRLRGRIARLENELVSLDTKVFSTRNTISFQLGAAILSAKKVAGLLALPKRLMELRAESKRRKTNKGGHAELIAKQADDRDRLDQLGARGACEIVVQEDDGNLIIMRRLMSLLALEVEREGSNAHVIYEFIRGQGASALDHARCAFWLAKAGYIDATLEALRSACSDSLVLTDGERSLMQRLEGMKQIEAHLPALLENREANLKARASAKRASKVIYCTNAAPPHSISGYSIRTHEMMRQGGTDFGVIPILRAGYQRDYAIAEDVFSFEGIDYTIIGGPSRRKVSMLSWVDAGANRIAEVAEREAASVIHAASNYLNALPGLVAARRLGLPFVYEVRGLWELSASALSPGWMNSEEFAFAREMETVIASNADRVVAISHSLRGELIDRGIDGEKIVVAPNGVDADRFRPGEKDLALAKRYGLDDCFVIGFFGSCMNYEGVLLLADVLSQLISNGQDVKLLVCGSGSGLEALKKRLEARRHEQYLVSIPHVPFQDISKFIHLADIVAMPRIDVPVCRIVPSMKILEAMASGRPVLASNLPVVSEYITNNKDGFLLPPGDTTAWVAVIEELRQNPSLREKVGCRATATARDKFAWNSTMRMIENVWIDLSKEANP